MSRLMISGCTGGGGWFGFGGGMSSLTAWVMIGSDRISVTSSTSITSINGVVLMSHISWPSLLPTLIDMGLVSSASALAAHAVIGLGYESDLDDPAAVD